MNKINNLIYTIDINYINNSGLNTSVSVKFNDKGLELRSIKVGDVCITEETINGRILSGKLENSNEYCGYRYDYQNGENLLNINPQRPIDESISLINKKKMEPDFLSAKLVRSSVLRNDYSIIILNSGNMNITKTISAENEKGEHCFLREDTKLLKMDGGERFVEQEKRTVYQIGEKCVIEDAHSSLDCDIKSRLNELSAIFIQNLQNYEELVKFKINYRKTKNNSTNEENHYE